MHVTDVSDDKASEAVLIGAVTGTGPESPEHLGLSIYESVDPKEATYSEIDRNQARSATESPEHLGLPIYESLKSKAKDATYTDLDRDEARYTHIQEHRVCRNVLT
ncbi:hypothetical protein MAR_021998 [Mya arenaria]|uniref:Uncharacterized protein n=1 Tax=Mya arenaria TaxID=6604 RepID=A0ABY7EBS5_MYAAR|nr:hypothetical protein MAR_021998 [Mya arenaria]